MEEIDLMLPKEWNSPLEMKKDFMNWYEENKIEQISEIRGGRLFERARKKPLTIENFALDNLWIPEDFKSFYGVNPDYYDVLRFIMALLTANFHDSATTGDINGTWLPTFGQNIFGIEYKKGESALQINDLIEDVPDAELAIAMLAVGDDI